MKEADKQNEFVCRLAALDWRTDAEIWKENLNPDKPSTGIVGADGKIDTNPAHLGGPNGIIMTIRKEIGLVENDTQMNVFDAHDSEQKSAI